MNAIRAAAIIALFTSGGGLLVTCYEWFQNVFLLRIEIDSLNYINGTGPNIEHSALIEYGIPLAVTIIFLIVGLALLGASQSRATAKG